MTSISGPDPRCNNKSVADDSKSTASHEDWQSDQSTTCSPQAAGDGFCLLEETPEETAEISKGSDGESDDVCAEYVDVGKVEAPYDLECAARLSIALNEAQECPTS